MSERMVFISYNELAPLQFRGSLRPQLPPSRSWVFAQKSCTTPSHLIEYSVVVSELSSGTSVLVYPTRDMYVHEPAGEMHHPSK